MSAGDLRTPRGIDPQGNNPRKELRHNENLRRAKGGGGGRDFFRRDGTYRSNPWGPLRCGYRPIQEHRRSADHGGPRRRKPPYSVGMGCGPHGKLSPLRQVLALELRFSRESSVGDAQCLTSQPSIPAWATCSSSRSTESNRHRASARQPSGAWGRLFG